MAKLKNFKQYDEVYKNPFKPPPRLIVSVTGYGVLPEECPSSAIGCRIKVDEGNLVWHQIARLYDRNHMVCVLPLEYQSEEGYE